MYKKIITGALLFSFLVIGTGCTRSSESGTEDSKKAGSSKITSKDVISKKNEVKDGEEITSYELKDGSTIELPRGADIDDADIVMED